MLIDFYVKTCSLRIPVSRTLQLKELYTARNYIQQGTIYSKELYKARNYIQQGSNYIQHGTIYRNTQLRYTHIMYRQCGMNVNKPSAPTEVEGKGLKL